MCRFPTKKIPLGANIEKQFKGPERWLSGFKRTGLKWISVSSR